MPIKNEAPDLDYFGFAHSPEGIDRAEMLAASAFEHFVTSVDAARLDTTIASVFLVSELLASVQHHDGVEPQDLIARFQYIIDERLSELKEASVADRVEQIRECVLH